MLGWQPQEVVMLILFVVLMVLWLILAIVGIAIDGLLWLGIIGIVLFLGTALIGGLRRRALKH
jgi:NADH:ubiquinone oxidoreductase subunit 3 (subunit A)